jgi:hypothetical protein
LMEEVARMVALSKDGVVANVEDSPFLVPPRPRTGVDRGAGPVQR